jgi:hypothetical protein
LINNTNGIKGLAGLATKLNPNSNQQHQTNSSASSIATSNLKKSSNPDFLFKKFKESATGGGVGGTVQQTNENKTADLIGKKGPVSLQVSSNSESNKKSTIHLNGLINSNSKTLIKSSLTGPNNNNNNNGNSSTTNNIHKKNPFNISNSLTTKTSNSCATQNNLKEKKINSNLKPNNIQSSSAITTNTSNSNTNRSSSKIS